MHPELSHVSHPMSEGPSNPYSGQTPISSQDHSAFANDMLSGWRTVHWTATDCGVRRDEATKTAPHLQSAHHVPSIQPFSGMQLSNPCLCVLLTHAPGSSPLPITILPNSIIIILRVLCVVIRSILVRLTFALHSGANLARETYSSGTAYTCAMTASRDVLPRNYWTTAMPAVPRTCKARPTKRTFTASDT
jgi:hypothetical protein